MRENFDKSFQVVSLRAVDPVPRWALGGSSSDSVQLSVAVAKCVGVPEILGRLSRPSVNACSGNDNRFAEASDVYE